jgi:hypothetical protein
VKLPTLVAAALFSALPARAHLISSIERLDTATPPNSLSHSDFTFRSGFPVWSDSTFQFRSAPSYLFGADQVRTRYLIDSSDPDFRLRITLEVPATVFLLIDNRAPEVSMLMPWVAALGFTDTGEDAAIQVSNDSLLTTASIYRAQFPAGDLVLLQQNDVPGNSGMYTVAVIPEPASLALLVVGAGMSLRRRPTRTLPAVTRPPSIG